MLCKTFPTPLALALTLLALPAGAAEVCSQVDRFGAGVEVTETTPVAEILGDPAAWEGKTVGVEGEVTEVCRMMGCWMELVAGDAEHRLRVKVEDGEIVFPVSARGRHAVAQGTVEVQEMSREEYVGWQRHLAEEQGRQLDEGAIGDGPYRLVQVRGTGAEICTDGGEAAAVSP